MTKPDVLGRHRSRNVVNLWRLKASCITQLEAQGPSRTFNESKEEDEEEEASGGGGDP